MRHILFAGLILILLCGCSVSQKQQQALTKKEPKTWQQTKEKLAELKSYIASGKAAFNQNGKGGSASLRWQQASDRFSIDLSLPLAGTLKIKGEPNLVSLMKPSGELAVAKTPEELVKKAFGFEIPVSGLRYWLIGLPAPDPAPVRILFNNEQRIGLLEQHGWVIEYQSYTNTSGMLLPEKITLERGDVKLKFIFTQWSS